MLKILMVDDEPDAIKKEENMIRDLGHDVTTVRSGQSAIAACDRGRYDVAFIDYSMPRMGGIETGRRLREKDPSIVLFILSVHEKEEYITRALEDGFDDYILKGALTKATLIKATLIKASRFCQSKRSLADITALAHSSYGLLQHVRHLVGVGPLLQELAKALEPFFQWNAGEYELLPKPLQNKFVSAILLEGEPGSGKSTICKAIASAFQSNAALPKDLGPSKFLGGWKKTLRENVQAIYVQALKQKVVVVRADDLVWPSVAEISDGAMAADWTAYLNTIRDCIEDADRINKGQKPEGCMVGDLSGFKGKIVWLFARNREEEVGRMFEPLRDKLKAFRVTFPANRDDRKAILCFRAQKEQVQFDGTALETALSATQNFDGRDLIGDETSQRGFLSFAISSVKERELARHRASASALRMIITPDIVQEWLQSEECKEINRRINSTAGNPFGGATGIHPDGAAAPLYPDERLLGIARRYLKDWERICQTYFPAKTRISQEDIASKSGGLRGKDRVTRESISAACKENGGVMLVCFDQSPSEFSTLLKKTRIHRWCHPGRGQDSCQGIAAL